MPLKVCLWLACVLGLVAAGARAQDAIEVSVSKAGFKPETIRLRRGEAARLSLRTTDEEHCFAVDALRVEKRVQPGRVTHLELTPDKAGSFPVYCCLEPDNAALRGRLVVAE
jgi:heme/copper-type cytochrome/quinol oxidase subunit 2